MATIKKGTYRFNDVPTNLGYSVTIDMPFITPTLVTPLPDEVVDEINAYIIEGGTDYPLIEKGTVVHIDYHYSQFAFFDIYGDGTTYSTQYYCDSATCNPNHPILHILVESDIGRFSEAYRSFDSMPWADSQIITVLEDTVVEDEAFATWFTENTQEVKAISGKRRFKDKLTPSYSEVSVTIPINFTCTYNQISEDFLSYTNSTLSFTRMNLDADGCLAYWDDDRFGGYYYQCNPNDYRLWCTSYLGYSRETIEPLLRETYPDLPDSTIEEVLDNLSVCYGESIKTVDFGTEPQYIPIDAWNWIMENTDEVIAKKFTRLYIGDTAYSSGGKCFKRLTTEEATILSAGLYDAEDNLVASWDTLVNTYGMDCEKDYTISNYTNTTESPNYILRFYEHLAGRKLIIDNSVSRIGDYTFKDSTNLTTVIIGSNVSRIGYRAFRNCTNLTSITIPATVTSIGDEAFRNCDGLTDIYYIGTEEQWADITVGTNNAPLVNATMHYNYTSNTVV